MGIVIGLFELIWYHNVNAFIFLLALPWQTMFVGYIVVGLTAYFVSLWKEEKKKYLQKKSFFTFNHRSRGNITKPIFLLLTW